MNPSSNPRCYDCNHLLQPGQERCPLCGAFVRARDRDERLQAELVKDRWSAPPDPSGRAKTISTANPASLVPPSSSDRPSRPPVAVGVEGRRGRKQKFDETIGLHVGQVDVAAAARQAHVTPVASARTLAGIAVQHAPTAQTSELGARTQAWRPLNPPVASQPTRQPPQDLTPDPSAALLIETMGLPNRRPSQMARPLLREQLGERAPGLSFRMSTDIPLFSLSLGFAVPAVVLLLTWFVPDLVQPPFTMPVQLVATAQGLELVGLLAAPLIGSLLLALAIAPFSDTLRCAIGLPLGLVGLTTTMLLTSLSLPLDGWILLAVALPMAMGAALAHRFSGMPLVGHLVTAAVPAALLVVAGMGFALGHFPLPYAAALKPPLLLWAFLQPMSLALAVLLWPLGRRSQF